MADHERFREYCWPVRDFLYLLAGLGGIALVRMIVGLVKDVLTAETILVASGELGRE
jgi:hypothetical protein